MIDLFDYEIFVRVIRAGSLSAAGRELNASPAMISKRLRRLEERLGARLLQRTTRRLTPTEIGQAFYERVLGILASVEEAEHCVTGGSDRARGLLRASAPTAFGRMHIAPRLKTFLDAHPELQLDIDLNDEYVDLVADGFDVAIRIGNLADSSLVARRLAPNRRVLCATPEYLHRHGAPQTLADLDKHQLLTAGPQVSWRFEGPEGPVSYKPRSVLQTNSSEVVREAVVSGMGIGFRSTWDVSDELRKGVLKRVLPAYGGAADVSIFAVYPTRHLVPFKVRAFVDYFARLYGSEPYWDRDLAPPLTQVVPLAAAS
jgi:DNA-binding transcriptional LysR family regulator